MKLLNENTCRKLKEVVTMKTGLPTIYIQNFHKDELVKVSL